MRALFRQNRIVSSIGGDLDHKSCWEILTDDALADAHFTAAERSTVPPPRAVDARRERARDPDAATAEADLLEFIRTHREELVLKPNRGTAARASCSARPRRKRVGARCSIARSRARAIRTTSWVVQAAATLPVHLSRCSIDGRATKSRSTS